MTKNNFGRAAVQRGAYGTDDVANTVLRYTIIAGIFILPFLSLFVSNHLFFPFITGKNFSFRIIVEIITALWLILAFRDTSVLPKTSRLLYAFLAFIGFLFISDILSSNVSKSFWSNYERMEGWVTLVHLLALFLVASSVMTKKVWEWLFRTSLVVSLILFVYGLLQMSGKLAIHQGATRIDATIGNSAYLGGYMLFHIFIAFYFFVAYIKEHYGTRTFNVFWPTFYAVSALAATFTLFSTATRGAEIGLAVGLFFVALGFLVFEREHKTLRRAGLGALVTLIILATLFVAGRTSDFVKRHEALSRLGAFTDQLLTFDAKKICEGDLKSRCLLWPMAWEGVKERPILGWGQESFNYVFNKYYDPRMYSQEQWFDRTHNVFLDWLIAGGVLGLLSYLSLFVVALYYLWRKTGPFAPAEKTILTALLIGYFFHNLTVFDNFTSYLMFALILAWIHERVGTRSEKLAEKVMAIDTGVSNRLVIPLISVVAVFTLYTVNIPPMLAAYELIQALSGGRAGGPAENLAHYKKALSYHSLGDSEIREQLVQSASQAAGLSGVDEKLRNEFYALAKREMELQLKDTPDDARYQLFTGSLLSNYGDYDGAITHLKKAHELSPNKQTVLFSLGGAYLGKKDYPNALATLKQAYDLDHAYSEGKRVYGLALIYTGQGKLAEEVLGGLSESVILGDVRFLQAFFTSGYFDAAFKSINFLLDKNPKNTEYYTARAAIQAKLGRKAAAIADLNKVAELNPSLKSQIDAYIKDIQAGKDI